MSRWTRIRNKIEDWMSASAFAECNEHDEALRLANIPEDRKAWSLDTLTTAITFAEAGEHDLAREVLGVESQAGREPATLRLPGIKVWVGTVNMEAEPLRIPGVRMWCGTVTA